MRQGSAEENRHASCLSTFQPAKPYEKRGERFSFGDNDEVPLSATSDRSDVITRRKMRWTRRRIVGEERKNHDNVKLNQVKKRSN